MYHKRLIRQGDCNSLLSQKGAELHHKLGGHTAFVGLWIVFHVEVWQVTGTKMRDVEENMLSSINA